MKSTVPALAPIALLGLAAILPACDYGGTFRLGFHGDLLDNNMVPMRNMNVTICAQVLDNNGVIADEDCNDFYTEDSERMKRDEDSCGIGCKSPTLFLVDVNSLDEVRIVAKVEGQEIVQEIKAAKFGGIYAYDFIDSKPHNPDFDAIIHMAVVLPCEFQVTLSDLPYEFYPEFQCPAHAQWPDLLR